MFSSKGLKEWQGRNYVPRSVPRYPSRGVSPAAANHHPPQRMSGSTRDPLVVRKEGGATGPVSRVSPAVGRVRTRRRSPR